jgi:hypothetical protein
MGSVSDSDLSEPAPLRICEKDIVLGERYYDGGYTRRGHVACVESEKFHEQV